MDIPISEISKLLDTNDDTFRYWLKTSEDLKTLLFKKTVIREEFSRGKYVKRRREMWFADSDNIEEIKKIALKKKCKEKRKYHGLYAWSRSALECYSAQYKCSKCINNYICSAFTRNGICPPIKRIVKEMVDKYGNPPKWILEDL